MQQYLAITANSLSDNNIMFESNNFKAATSHLKKLIKKDTMFQEIKLVELNSMLSRTFFINK
jgi:hypothetical protein